MGKRLSNSLSEEFILAVRIGLPNYFDYKNGKITPKENKVKTWASNKKVN